jgi:hypothetical protein
MKNTAFEHLIQPCFEICMDARERGIEPVNMGLAMIGAGRDAVIAEAGPAVAAAALLAALHAIRQEHGEAVEQALEASVGQTSNAGLQ